MLSMTVPGDPLLSWRNSKSSTNVPLPTVSAATSIELSTPLDVAVNIGAVEFAPA